jgi:lipopolysaccharide transport system ATP-binding protein
MQPVIQVNGLSKRYSLRHERGGPRYVALRDVLTESIRNAARRVVGRGPPDPDAASREEFWALKDVSFDIMPGDVVGIIGRNGAGKSTLLKILSRITEPTRGRVELRGRASSLLEVGTGFHPELTGRENIQLNGAILGMRREEIRRKFDQIVAFAEVEKFLDTPVKHYSSGMYVRLAFSVAAHLDPEILIIDEVLAVGDIEFQNKCLGKMQEVSKGGRTVLFVSHNMGAIQTLCRSAIYLHQGQVRQIGRADEVVAAYSMDAKPDAPGAGQTMRLSESLFLEACEMTPNPVTSGDPVNFRLRIRSQRPTRMTELTFLVMSPQGNRVGVIDVRPALPRTLEAGEALEVRGVISTFPMVEGDYTTLLYLVTSDYAGDFGNLPGITVNPRPNASGIAPYSAVYRGVFEYDYEIQSVEVGAHAPLA